MPGCAWQRLSTSAAPTCPSPCHACHIPAPARPSTPHGQSSLPGFLLLQAQLEGHASSSRQASLGCQREPTTAPWASSHLELTHSSSGLRVCGDLVLSPCPLQPQSNAREGSLCLCTMASELEQGLEPEFFPAWTAQAFAEMSGEGPDLGLFCPGLHLGPRWRGTWQGGQGQAGRRTEVRPRVGGPVTAVWQSQTRLG